MMVKLGFPPLPPLPLPRPPLAERVMIGLAARGSWISAFSSWSTTSLGTLVYFFSSLSLVRICISPFRQTTLVRSSVFSFLHFSPIFSSSLLSFMRSAGMASCTLTLWFFFPLLAGCMNACMDIVSPATDFAMRWPHHQSVAATALQLFQIR